jgi:hypothetical protein
MQIKGTGERLERQHVPASSGMGSRRKEEYDAMRMQEIDIHDYARQLLDAHGDRAIVEAAQKASALEQQGQSEQARTWRQIEAALRSMRGPHVS